MNAPITATQKLAARMLEVRKRGGYTLGMFLRWNAKSYIFAVAYLTAAIAYFAWVEMSWGCYLVIGLFAGMWLRDFGYLRAANKSWPFMDWALDWEKVEQLAGSGISDLDQADA
jgi:hypothetical protein